MKMKKRLFPFLLIFAISLTVTGLLSINQSFAVTEDEELKDFSLYINQVDVKNIDILSSDNTNISYIIKLDENKKEYYISFDVNNDNKYNLFLTNYYIDQIPDELKDLLTLDITNDQRINSYDKSHMTIKYTLKNNLTESEKSIVENYKNIKVNLLLNYVQE